MLGGSCMFDKRVYVIAAAAGLLLVLGFGASFGAGPTFAPDASFKGSSLVGWHTLGQAEWRAHDGELIGAAKNGPGWLLLDRSYQDAALFAHFQCTGECKTGVLLRAEKTADGMKGIFVSLNDGDIASYRVTLDAQGKEVQREKLRYAGGQVRIAPPPDPNAPGRGGRGGRGVP